MFNECRHIKDDGQRCRSAALKGKPYCYFHMKFESIHKVEPDLPPIEGPTSILLAIGQVVRGLKQKTIDSKHAGLMLYGLQIAASVARQREQAAPAQPVRSIHNLAGEPVDFHQAYFIDKNMLAPENTLCEPPLDCVDCQKKETCTKPDAVIDRKHFSAWHIAMNAPGLSVLESKKLIFAYCDWLDAEKAFQASKAFEGKNPIPVPTPQSLALHASVHNEENKAALPSLPLSETRHTVAGTQEP